MKYIVERLIIIEKKNEFVIVKILNALCEYFYAFSHL